LPDAVVFPEKFEQISKLLQICNREKIPVIAYGAGSGLEGGVNAIHVIFFQHLNCSLIRKKRIN
jgi:FAD/FMN-containing dehydrogenase